MRKIRKPTDNPGAVYDVCISIVKNRTLKARLASIKPDIEAAAVAYETAASSVMLHTLPQEDNVGGLSKKEMADVYEYRMAQQGTPGRLVYDMLMTAPTHGRCPLCGQRIVSTLDHYLPQTHYPALVVMPINLVPACPECNKIKRAIVPDTREKLTLHPYYDDVEGDRWLYAEVVEVIPAAIRFFVDPPTHWDAILAARVRNHFQLFQLGSLYSSNAASELAEMHHLLARLFASAGAEAVKEHLQDQATSCSHVHINSRRTAMFEALTASDWFCAGGF